MLSNLLAGLRYLIRGVKLFLKPGIFPYVFAPLIINAALFTVALILTIAQYRRLLDWLLAQLPGWLQWLSAPLWVVFALSVLFVLFPVFSLIANLVSAPFNGPLAAAVERHLTGRAPTGGGWQEALGDIPRSVAQEARKLAYFAVRAVPLLLLFAIPGLNLLAPWLWVGFSAWMLALEYSDYPLGNRGMDFAAQRRALREHRSLALGFGGAALLATSIPLVNFLVIPAAVAGATAMWVEQRHPPDQVAA